MATIKHVRARQVFDSRGNPTVAVDLTTNDGVVSASVPSGASTGSYEARELRDGGKPFGGLGVTKAVAHVNGPIANLLQGKTLDQKSVDDAMVRLDGTPNKSRLGANAILGVSLAVARAIARSKGAPLYRSLALEAGVKRISLPIPFFNVINGGKHADDPLDIQEYMVVPYKEKSFSAAMRAGVETYHALKRIVREKYGVGSDNVGDEGGFAPQIKDPEEPLHLLHDAADAADHSGLAFGLDCAATAWKTGKSYRLGGRLYTPEQLIDWYASIVKNERVISIEDPFAEDAFNEFAMLTKRVNGKAQVVGDDLTVTNPQRIQKAVEKKSCNCLLLKVNQIGTVTEALQSAAIARQAGWNVMVSHRSGETEDSFIADLAVALCAQIKAGAPARGERLAKYNRLLQIEEELGRKARYGGRVV